MKSGFAKATKAFLNLVYPLECSICKAGLDPFSAACLCDKCKNKIKLNLPPFCSKCGLPLNSSSRINNYCPDCGRTIYNFTRTWAVGYYDGILKECIHLFKFNGRQCLLPVFLELFLNFAKLYIKLDEFDALVPVPLHKTKLRERNFNHIELLAKSFSAEASIALDSNNLIKTKHTPPQTELSKEQRASNIKGAFGVANPIAIKDKSILLMDDVFTTGYTLSECAKILKSNGAKSVSCLVLARGILKT